MAERRKSATKYIVGFRVALKYMGGRGSDEEGI